MNELKVFENERYGRVRTVMQNGEPWFVAADVCSVLDLSNPTIAVSRLDEDERAKFNLGRQGDATIVNEPGLYALILGSRKPEAKEFKRWITHEVIPSIRRTGSYSAMPTDYLTALKALVAAEEERVRLAAENKALLPKAEYHDEVLNKPGLICTSTIAKDLGLSSAAKLNKMLNDHNVIYRDGSGTWKTYAEYEYLMTDGYADYQSYTGANTKPTLKWTEKGRKWLSEKVQVWA